MDPIRAELMTKELLGNEVNGWLVNEFIDSGKSALVLKAEKGGRQAAIKVFDRELVQRCGAPAQLERIKRELTLVGKHHPNLIEILDGGHCDKFKVFFVVMQYFAGTNLEKVRGKVPYENIRPLISQIAAAAKFLEDHGLAHRDIKPSNIGIDSEFKRAVLLDLGVLRPAGPVNPVTDQEFVGTLQYSSPEFLLGQVEETTDGWRAVTFYQLGAVLHDLITRKALFGEFAKPFARLVNAVQNERPDINSTHVPSDLIELARHCLVKPANLRLRLVSWKDFEPHGASADRLTTIRERVAKRCIAAKDTAGRPEAVQNRREIEHLAKTKLSDYSEELKLIVRHECVGNSSFPPIALRERHAASQDSSRFGIVFEPSPRHGLALHLAVEICLSWVDAQNDIVELAASAVAAPDPIGEKDTINVKLQVLYRGCFIKDAIAEPICVAVYRALECAQGIRQKMKPSKASSSRSGKELPAVIQLTETEVRHNE